MTSISSRVALSLAIVVSVLSVRSADAQVVPAIVPGLTVEIADIIQMPNTQGQGQEDSRSGNNVARINFLREDPSDSSNWFINDLRGQIYRVDPAAQQIETYLDVDTVFDDFIIGDGGLSTGLITLTMHPDFATNGKFYTIHEEKASGNPSTPDFQAIGNAGNISNGQHGVVVEWTASDPMASTFSGTHREMMRIAQPSGNLHNMGDIGFNPHATDPSHPDYGIMYLAGGDAGYDSEGKGSDQARELSSIFGKILRIDPSGNNSANGQYGVPTDNPYASDGDANTLGEIYASGFRNAHRIMWDMDTETFLTTDIGQGSVEEINILESGGDYGWDKYEGTFTRGGGIVPRGGDVGYVWPAAQYDHADGFAIAGGFVYRGEQIPQLEGKFIYGDIRNGRIYYSDLDELIAAHTDDDFLATATVYELFLTQDREPVSLESLVIESRGLNSLPNNRVDLRFAQTSDGEIYLTTKQDGWVRQLVGNAHLGDYNKDGLVDAADFTVWRDTLDMTGSNLAADGNGNGVIDMGDYDVWVANFGMSAPGLATSTAVPEPTGAVLLLGAALAWRQQRRRR
ncbi:Soluble aldose sugar dehydrogenase YliI precursor [Pseudobythopirellula maris]|uniref:Soluble aldose sugar dehydrogenase YliI n=1 Tax=Pseudobythopirellula maris TaxID=2527991 RepID=A0A5C5ZTU5_9BACT|nr:PQQ-dependent sugar dehydrogenase [Pseudobythopirellula maris]TWT90515.1 Soluble aldose sugar dehydrogenase YliI precursor [Pseudobythopirellula maris]